MEAAKHFAKVVIAVEHASSYSKKHKVTHCGELAQRVLYEFMSSEDPEIRKHPIGIVTLTHALATDNHAFAIIFAENNAPAPSSIVESSLVDIIDKYPDAQAVDLWNHLSFPLAHFNDAEKFKQSITEHLPYVLHSGDEPGARLPKATAKIQRVADEYSEKVRDYYHGLSNCQIEVMPAAPPPECTIDTTAFKA